MVDSVALVQLCMRTRFVEANNGAIILVGVGCRRICVTINKRASQQTLAANACAHKQHCSAESVHADSL